MTPTAATWRRSLKREPIVAGRVARRLNASPSVHQELDADAVGHIFGVLDKFDAKRASFAA